MGQWLTYAITQTADSDTSRSYRLQIWYNSSLGVNDTTNDFDVWGGDWPARTNYSQTVYVPSGGGSTLIYDETIAFTKVYGSAFTVDFGASLTGINYWGSSQVISTSGSASVPARPYSIPTAPSSCTATRVSDTQQTIAWTRNPTTAGPYDNIKVQRRLGGGAWSTVATLAGTATSWSDTTTAKDGRYDYQIAASNSAGTSSYTRTSPDVSTTPNDPTTFVGVKNGDGTITLTWDDDDSGYPGGWRSRFDIERSVNGGAYSNVANDLAEGTRTWTDSSPGVGTNTYRIQAWVPNTGQTASTLSSGWATSNTVQTTAPPNAPTNLAMSPALFDGTNTTSQMTWLHNPTDSSTQRKYQIQHRLVGSGTWTTLTAMTLEFQYANWSAAYWTTTAGYSNGDTVEWQVRTWGAATTGGADGTGASAWSATSTFTIKSRPTATLSSPTPSQVLTTSTLTVTWAYYQAQASAQSSWRARLYKSGTLVSTKTGTGTGTTTSFTALENLSSYSVQVDVTSADGLVSGVDSESFTTDFLPPEDAVVTLDFDPGSAAVAITVTPQGYVPGVTVAATGFTLERSVDGGMTWVTYLESVPLNGAPVAVTDYAPRLGGETLYRVTVYSASPSSALTADSPLTLDTTGLVSAVWLNAGAGFSVGCNVRANVTENSTHNRAVRVLRHYAGRPKPVAHVGVGVVDSWSVNADVISPTSDPGASTPDEWRAFSKEDGPFLLRSPGGLYETVSLGASGVSISREVGGARFRIAFTAEAIDG